MTGIKWYKNDNVADAIYEARSRNIPLLIDFWSPTCTGCAKMFITTYQEPEIQHLVSSRVVPIKFDTTGSNEWFKRLNGNYVHMWHPHIAILDHRLIASRRIVGYLHKEEFGANVLAGVGLHELYQRAFPAAIATFGSIVRDYPNAAVAPEAMYWAGVASYRVEGKSGLINWWSLLPARYPDSDWTERANCLDVTIPDSGFSPDDLATVTINAALAT